MSKKQKIHVMHLIGSTGLFGAERWILALMRALDTDRIKSTLVNLADGAEGQKKSDIVSAACQRGFKAFDFQTGGKLNPLAAVRLARWARTHNVRIIHGHGFKSDVTGLVAARLAGCKVITTPHGWSPEDRKTAFYERVDRMTFRFMDQVCPLSPALEEGLRVYAKAKIRLILNGVDIDELNETVPAVTADTGNFIIGYVGRLVEGKDLGTLLSAIKLLKEKNEKVRLVLIGCGYKGADLERQAYELGIKDNIDFMGFRADAVCFLKTFHFFVLPSLSEGIPRCIMEAMAAGIPVIASDIQGNRQLVSHGDTGLLFTPGDSSDLADKLRHCMRNPGETRAMAVKARQKVEREFSNRRMAAEYAALYGELAGK